MQNLKEKIKNHFKQKIQDKILDKIDSLKAEMKKKFTIAGLFILGIILILQGFVRLFPRLIKVPEYVGFFIMGGIVMIIAFVYYFSDKK